MRSVALEHAVADLALRILDQKAALGAFHKDDERDDRDGDHDDGKNDADRELARPAELERIAERPRQGRDDAGEDDQRNAVADAARGDLLAEPHQEHRAAEEGDDRRDPEEPAGIGDHAGRALEAHRNAVGLQHAEQHRAVAGVLVDDLAALLAFLLELLQRGNDRGHELHDDRGGDVRHDAEREDRHAFHGAAGEHVEEAENALLMPREGLPEGGGVDTRQRNVGAETIDEQRAQGEPEALLQVFRLGESREVEIRGKLFRCRSHAFLRVADPAAVKPGQVRNG